MPIVVQLVVVAVLAAVIASTEVTSRFRDEPLKALTSWPAVGYLVVNIALSLGVLALAVGFSWRFGVSADSSALQLDLTRVLVAGLGAAVVLRSSLLTVKLGGHDVGVGPNAAFTALLSTIERSIDRRRAGERLKLSLWEGLSFADDYAPLVELVSYSLQRLDLADADSLGALVGRLQKREELSDANRLDRLGFELLNIAGEATVAGAVERIVAAKARREPVAAEPADDWGRGFDPAPAPAQPSPSEVEAPAASPPETKLSAICGSFADTLPDHVAFRHAQVLCLFAEGSADDVVGVIDHALRLRPNNLGLQLLRDRVDPARVAPYRTTFSSAPAAIKAEAAFQLARKLVLDDEASLRGDALSEAALDPEAHWYPQVHLLNAAVAVDQLEEEQAAEELGRYLASIRRIDIHIWEELAAFAAILPTIRATETRTLIDQIAADHGLKEYVTIRRKFDSNYAAGLDEARRKIIQRMFVPALTGVALESPIPGSGYPDSSGVIEMVRAALMPVSDAGAPASDDEQAQLPV
jgi:hypothetical protein